MPLRPLRPDLLEKARSELHEDPARLEQDLQHIKNWLKKQPHITAWMDDQWLLAFLRGCKFSLERTKEKLDCYYTMKTALPGFYTGRDPLGAPEQEILSAGVLVLLPKLDALGRRVVIIRPGQVDAGRFPIEQMIRTNLMQMEVVMLEDDDAIVNGTVNVMDMEGVTLAHALQMTPGFIRQMQVCFQEAYPHRLKSLNYLHLPPTFDTVLGWFKSAMTEKLKRRIHLHGDSLESLYKQVPREILPKEYGGDAGPVADIVAAWKGKMEGYREHFLQDSHCKVEEKLRPGKPKNREELFGMVGSFRKLNVD